MNGAPIGEQPEPERAEPERVRVVAVSLPHGQPPEVILSNGMILDGLDLVEFGPVGEPIAGGERMLARLQIAVVYGP